MKTIIRTIMFCCIFQILASGVFATYMLDRASILSQNYTDTALRLQYNQLQIQFSDERSSMKDYVENRFSAY